jgi:hypothetical protein
MSELRQSAPDCQARLCRTWAVCQLILSRGLLFPASNRTPASPGAHVRLRAGCMPCLAALSSRGGYSYLALIR